MKRTLLVRIYRYDPEGDGEPRYGSYRVPFEGRMTVLDVLRYVYRELDGTLAFRWACGIGKCGTCSVRLNGKPVLSCRQPIDGGADEVLIEPLANYPVVKDLVVDRERYQRGLSNSLIHLRGMDRVPLLLTPRLITDEALGECIECLVCDSGCPVLIERLQEYPGPSLLTGVAGRSESDEAPNEALEEARFEVFRCLQCGRCTAACRGGVSTDHLILAAREGLARRGLLPEALQAFGETVAVQHNVSGEDNSGRLIWAQNLEGGLAVAEAGTPLEVLYFVGCLGSLFPSSYRVPQALVQILEAAGVPYGLMGGEEWCCAYPLLLGGMTDQARELIRHNLNAVRGRGAPRMVMACPSCYYTWKELYPQVMGEEVGVEILHAVELLESLVDEGRLPLGEVPMRVTYHDPCDLGRKSGIYEAPRQVLRAIPGVELVEMVDNREDALCCGGGSNLETYDPELMRKVAHRRLGQALETGAEAIITACTQCERTLKDAARRERAKVRVMDVTEIVWRAAKAAGQDRKGGDGEGLL